MSTGCSLGAMTAHQMPQEQVVWEAKVLGEGEHILPATGKYNDEQFVSLTVMFKPGI